LIATPLNIGVSICDNRFDEYITWLNSTKIPVKIIELFYKNNNWQDFKNCDALILTGGIDINPELYGKGDQSHLCREIKKDRDEFELKLIDSALNGYKSILGVCRGMQIVNASPNFNGTMICDIEIEFKNIPVKVCHSVPGKEGCSHTIKIIDNTILREITKNNLMVVNSFHHQAVERPGNGLCVSSTSDDGIIESLEWEDKNRTPFVLLVQWHPERMDPDSVLSTGILRYFYENI
jgi:putative glutamine amidotransferase